MARRNWETFTKAEVRSERSVNVGGEPQTAGRSSVGRKYAAFFSPRKCSICGKVLNGPLHIDHIVPVALGGSSKGANLQVTCPECNLKKGKKLVPQATMRIQEKEKWRQSIAGYFSSQDLWVSSNPNLRVPQKEAYKALYKHFKRATDLSKPALVVLPTGCGKSGVVALTPFFIAEGRVLVVAPNLTVKKSLLKALDPASEDNFLLKTRVMIGPETLPTLAELSAGKVNYEDCMRSHIVLANIQYLNNWLDFFEEDFFDLIIMDEAHHAPAETWQRVLSRFPKAKAVFLTATPYRGDRKPLGAELVYEYPLSQAIANGYVKFPVFTEAVSDRLEFVEGSTEKTVTLEEVMKLREEEWFSRSIAMAYPCNLHIVEKSLEILSLKREGGYDHQVIATAMSIAHAEQIVKIYRSKGVKAILVHSDMPIRKRRQIMEFFEKGRADVVVQVGILGEGYDHPPISVAAIFRPYRSFAPFAQIVGRTLRCIPGGTRMDNRADIVTHVGLNLEKFWEYYADESKRAKFLLEEGEKAKRRDSAHGHGTKTKEPKRIEVIEDHLSHYETRIFPVERVDKGLLVEDKRPDLLRDRSRKLLDKAVKDAAGRIVQDLRLDENPDVLKALIRGDERSAFEVVVRLLNRCINQALKKDPHSSDRQLWTIDELRRGMELIPVVKRRVSKKIRRCVK